MELHERKFAEDMIFVSVFEFNAIGLFRSGTHTGKILRGDDEISMGIIMDDRGFGIATFTYFPALTKNSSHTHRISIVPTPCKFGGVRHWFRCPTCRSEDNHGLRVTKLFFVEDRIFCRICGNVSYRSKIHPTQTRY